MDYKTCASHCKAMYLGGKEFTPVFENAFNQIYDGGSLSKDDAVTALPRILQEQLGNDELTMEERTALSLVAIGRALNVYSLFDQLQPNFDYCLLGIVAVSQGDLNKITDQAAFRIQNKDTCGILFQIVDRKTGNRLNISALTGSGDVPLNDEVTALTAKDDGIISTNNIKFDVKNLEGTVLVQAVHYGVDATSERLEREHAAREGSDQLFGVIKAR
jgi:hypothetical protein